MSPGRTAAMALGGTALLTAGCFLGGKIAAAHHVPIAQMLAVAWLAGLGGAAYSYAMYASRKGNER